MDPMYLLTKLFEKVVEARKAQKAYYAYEAQFKDPVKQAYLAEARRREQDLDKLVVTICTAKPELAKLAKEIFAA